MIYLEHIVLVHMYVRLPDTRDVYVFQLFRSVRQCGGIPNPQECSVLNTTIPSSITSKTEYVTNTGYMNFGWDLPSQGFCVPGYLCENNPSGNITLLFSRGRSSTTNLVV